MNTEEAEFLRVIQMKDLAYRICYDLRQESPSFAATWAEADRLQSAIERSLLARVKCPVPRAGEFAAGQAA